MPKLGGWWLRQEDHKLEASLGYTARHCLKKKRKTKAKTIYQLVEAAQRVTEEERTNVSDIL